MMNVLLSFLSNQNTIMRIGFSSLAKEKHYLSKPSNFIWPTQFNTDGITVHEGKSDYLYRGIWGVWRWFEMADIQGKTIAFKKPYF